jgi:hypothetical protein
MCLFPNGGARNMCQPIIPITPKSAKYKKLLCGTAILQVIMAIMIMFFNPYDATN